MDFLTQILDLTGKGAKAYVLARQIRDQKTRPHILTSLYLSESSSVPYLEALHQRAKSEGKEWLSQQLQMHASDEKKHSRIFAYALEKYGKKVEPFDPNSQSSEQKASPLFIAYFKGYDRKQLIPENIDWSLYAASTYVLEASSAKDYKLMAQALPEDNLQERKLKMSLLSIAKDEARHANYLHEVLTRSWPSPKVKEILDFWQARQAKALWAMAGHLNF